MDGQVVWITGPPASGKTTLAHRLFADLRARGVPTLWLDGDDLRRVITPDPTYSEEERDSFYRCLGHLAVLGAKGGTLVLVSATASRRKYRDRVRRTLSAERAGRFVEVFLSCQPQVLRGRDPKGLYALAEMGAAPNLPGAGAPYEPPLAPEVALCSDTRAPEALADAVLQWLDEHT